MTGAARRPGAGPGRARTTLALLVAVVLLRCWDWGNPVIHVDEQWYLLVADRMLAGAVPYIDIWDRKPVGLFLHFLPAALLPGDGILAYQLVATAYAAATALLVARGARVVGAGERGSATAGLLYLLTLALLGGRGGQSPVFYNLYMAAAGLLVLRLPGRTEQAAVMASGAAACLLAGLAIQTKYTPAIEGAFFGLAHLAALRRTGGRPPLLIGAAGLWVVLGLLPTLLVAGWYWRHGAIGPWWFANVTSIALRPGYPWDQLAGRLLGVMAQLSALAGCAVLAWLQCPRAPALRLAFGWLAAAVVGFLAIGTFFDHYALPLVAPLCVAASPALGRARPRVAALVLAFGLFGTKLARTPDDGPGARRVAELVRLNSVGGCPYVFAGDTATYLLADACLPTTRAFPNLLSYWTERGATGIDEAAEVRRVLAGRPPVILGTTRPRLPWNRDSLLAVRRALARDYRPVFTTPRGGYRTVLWVRRDLPFRR